MEGSSVLDVAKSYDLISTVEASTLLGLSDEMVRHLVRRGELPPAVRNDRAIFVERSAVMELLEARRVQGLKTPDAPNKTGAGRPPKVPVPLRQHAPSNGQHDRPTGRYGCA